jgi:hypothetical protein
VVASPRPLEGCLATRGSTRAEGSLRQGTFRPALTTPNLGIEPAPPRVRLSEPFRHRSPPRRAGCRRTDQQAGCRAAVRVPSHRRLAMDGQNGELVGERLRLRDARRVQGPLDVRPVHCRLSPAQACRMRYTGTATAKAGVQAAHRSLDGPRDRASDRRAPVPAPFAGDRAMCRHRGRSVGRRDG